MGILRDTRRRRRKLVDKYLGPDEIHRQNMIKQEKHNRKIKGMNKLKH